jgi:hypothetical protein
MQVKFSRRRGSGAGKAGGVIRAILIAANEDLFFLRV